MFVFSTKGRGRPGGQFEVLFVGGLSMNLAFSGMGKNRIAFFLLFFSGAAGHSSRTVACT
jgi:hypothetical protein